MTQVELAAQRLFGPGGLGVTNIGISRGSDPNVTAEEIAGEINRALDQLEAGTAEIVDINEID
jgi:hypothetical protein